MEINLSPFLSLSLSLALIFFLSVFILSFLPLFVLIFFSSSFPSSFLSAAVTAAFLAPAQYPGCSGTRNLRDNLSDLRAQVAANQKGCQLVGEMIDSYGLAVVQAYMGHIQVGFENQV